MSGLTAVGVEHGTVRQSSVGAGVRFCTPESSHPQRKPHLLEKHGRIKQMRVQHLDHTIAGALQRLSSQALYDSHGLITALPIGDSSQGHVSGHRKAPCPVLSFPNSNHTSRGAICPLYRA